MFVYDAPSEFSNVTVSKTADPFTAAVVGNSNVTGFDELPAAMSPRTGEGEMLVAGTPFKDADLIVTPVAFPNPVAIPNAPAVTRTG